MAESSAPFNGGRLMFEAEWGEVFGAALESGVVPQADDAMKVYTDIDGRQVKVKPGMAILRGHLYKNDSVNVVPVAANPTGSTNRRFDRVVLRLNPTDIYVGRVGPKTIGVDIVQGTPGADPLRPLLTKVPGGVWEVGIGTVVASPNFTTLTVDALTDERVFARPKADVGTITPVAGTKLGYNKLLCDGALHRVDVYPDLAAYLGTRYGGDGVRTFGVPDYRERNPIGAALTSSGAGSVGTTGGNATTAFAQENLPAFDLTVDDDGHVHHAVDYQFMTGSAPGSTQYLSNGSNVDHAPGYNIVPFDNTEVATTGIRVRSGGLGTPLATRDPYIYAPFEIQAF